MGRPMIDRTGEVHLSNKGEKIEVIECYGNKNLTVKFEDGTIATGVTYGDLERNKVKNYNRPNFSGVGFVGYGNYCTLKHALTYGRWGDVIDRCYKNGERCYEEVTVHPDWHNFQNFAEWFYKNYDVDTMKKWHLDKDILVPGNKVYGPDTCCFVPPEINYLFRKCVKNKTVQDVVEITEKYKSILSEEVHTAIIRYK